MTDAPLDPRPLDDVMDRLVAEYSDRLGGGRAPATADLLAEVPEEHRLALARCFKMIDAEAGGDLADRAVGLVAQPNCLTFELRAVLPSFSGHGLVLARSISAPFLSVHFSGGRSNPVSRVELRAELEACALASLAAGQPRSTNQQRSTASTTTPAPATSQRVVAALLARRRVRSGHPAA